MIAADRESTYNGPTQTVGATLVTVWQRDISDFGEDSVIDCDVVIVGRQPSTGLGISGRFRACFTRIAGVLSLAGNLQTVTALQGSIVGAFTVSCDSSGDMARMRVTGAAGVTVDWDGAGEVTTTGLAAPVLLKPADGSSWAVGAALQLVTDTDVAATSEEFYIDGGLVATVTAAPFRFEYDTIDLAVGAHTYMVRRYYGGVSTDSFTETFTLVWSPLHLPLRMWLHADSVPFAGASQIGRWGDDSGEGHTFYATAAGTRYTYASGRVGSADATNFLQSIEASSVWRPWHDGSGMTGYSRFVIPTGAGSSNALLGTCANGAGVGMRIIANGAGERLLFEIRNAAGVIFTAQTAAASTPIDADIEIIWRYDTALATDMEVWLQVDGGGWASVIAGDLTDVPDAGDPLGTLRLGALGDDGSKARIEFQQLIWFDSLSDLEITELQTNGAACLTRRVPFVLRAFGESTTQVNAWQQTFFYRSLIDPRYVLYYVGSHNGAAANYLPDPIWATEGWTSQDIEQLTTTVQGTSGTDWTNADGILLYTGLNEAGNYDLTNPVVLADSYTRLQTLLALCVEQCPYARRFLSTCSNSTSATRGPRVDAFNAGLQAQGVIADWANFVDLQSGPYAFTDADVSADQIHPEIAIQPAPPNSDTVGYPKIGNTYGDAFGMP
jgi:hypothetical protein